MATTAKILPPGIMPGKDEIEKYIRLYEDPEFTLGDRITSFDSSTLPEHYTETFCRRYQFYTLVGVEDDYSTDEPVQYRCNLMRIRHQSNMEELAKKELRFWEKKDEKAFKYLRTAFSTAIGSKICVDYLEKQCAAFTPEENVRQVAEYKAAEEKRFKEWLEKAGTR